MESDDLARASTAGVLKQVAGLKKEVAGLKEEWTKEAGTPEARLDPPLPAQSPPGHIAAWPAAVPALQGAAAPPPALSTGAPTLSPTEHSGAATVTVIEPVSDLAAQAETLHKALLEEMGEKTLSEALAFGGAEFKQRHEKLVKAAHNALSGPFQGY
jgi:hypothetical protein